MTTAASMARTTRGLTDHGLLIVAGLAAVASLGLQWASAMELKYQIPMWYPGFCHVAYDADGWAYTECDPYWTGGGYTVGASDHFVGYQLSVRVLAPAALLLGVMGVRTGRRWLIWLAAIAAVGGLVVGGLRVYPGQIAYVIALVAAGTALVRAGHLRVGREVSGRDRDDAAPFRIDPPAGSAPHPDVRRA